jgi:hypothetical protein
VRKSYYEHIIRMDSERLIKISRYNILAGESSPRRPKIRWSDFIPG